MNYKIGVANEGYKFIYTKQNITVSDELNKIWETQNIHLTCGKNDWAAFQIVVESKEDGTLSLGENPAFSYQGNVSDLRLSASAEGNLSITMQPIEPMTDDDSIEKDDIILNTDMVYLKKNKPQTVWVETSIPHDISEGVYNGKIEFFTHNLFEPETKIHEITFSIQVKNVTLPEPKDYKFYLDLWQHPSNIARKHEVLYWSDEHFEILEGYIKTLADLGQKAVTAIVTEIPWSGQRCFNDFVNPSDLYEYSMVKVTKGADGFAYDYSSLKRYIDLCFKHGIDSEIEVFGLINIWVGEEGFSSISDYPDALRIRYFDSSDSCYKYMCNAEDIKNYIKNLQQFFINENLLDKVLVVADEPSDMEKYRISLKTLKQTAPLFKYKTAINHAEFIDELKDDVADIVPYLFCTAREWDLIKKFQPEHKGRILWYVCCGPDYPNTFLKSPLAESRLIPIFTYYMGLDGFLRWNYTVWPQNPRQDIRFRYPYWKAGDTNFVYPSYNGQPLLTNRYKILKRGIADYELLLKLEEKCGKDSEVFEKIWQLILKDRDVRNFNHQDSHKTAEELYSINYNDYEQVKCAILENLE